MEKPFRFQHFEVDQNGVGFKFTSDSILLGALAPIEEAKEILEIGTATGVIALMMAQRCEANITAVEIDEGSARVAKKNFKESKWNNRLQLIHSDATLVDYEKEKQFDWIICNPPYFSDSMLSVNERKNTGRHQDSLNPKSLMETFIKVSNEFGNLLIISTPNYIKELVAIGVMNGLWCQKIIDIYSKPGKEAIRQIGWLRQEQCAFLQETFFIRDENNQYSAEYKNALKDYLLNLG
jgi:tRNA1Val (adenine37-N6)-methyltransferase